MNAFRFVCTGLVAAAGMPVAGCGFLGFSSGSGKLTSTGSGASLSANFSTRVYSGNEVNVADFYLTDLPASVWEQGGDVSDVSGNILHIHMFIAPKAGSTPIESTASSATVRWMVLAQGRIGIYGGGGFFTESGDVGDSGLGGTLSDASLRLVQASPGFADRLGPSVLSLSIDTKHDETVAAGIARAISSLAGGVREVGDDPR